MLAEVTPGRNQTPVYHKWMNNLFYDEVFIIGSVAAGEIVTVLQFSDNRLQAKILYSRGVGVVLTIDLDFLAPKKNV